MNAYVYQAALWCETCAGEIRRGLSAAKRLSADSDDCPQGPYANGGGEADTPQHCDGCDVFLENPLTSEGYAYVRETLENTLVPRKNSVAWQIWAPFYDALKDE